MRINTNIHFIAMKQRNEKKYIYFSSNILTCLCMLRQPLPCEWTQRALTSTWELVSGRDLEPKMSCSYQTVLAMQQRIWLIVMLSFNDLVSKYDKKPQCTTVYNYLFVNVESAKPVIIISYIGSRVRCLCKITKT